MANIDQLFSSLNLYGGEFERKLDSQHRFALPAEWRKAEDAVYVLMLADDMVLQLYPVEVFKEKIQSNVNNLSPLPPKNSKDLRNMGARFRPCVCDKQGRIQIPDKMLERLNFKVGESITLIGTFDFIQIMNTERRKQEEEESFECGNTLENIDQQIRELNDHGN